MVKGNPRGISRVDQLSHSDHILANDATFNNDASMATPSKTGDRNTTSLIQQYTEDTTQRNKNTHHSTQPPPPTATTSRSRGTTANKKFGQRPLGTHHRSRNPRPDKVEYKAVLRWPDVVQCTHQYPCYPHRCCLSWHLACNVSVDRFRFSYHPLMDHTSSHRSLFDRLSSD